MAIEKKIKITIDSSKAKARIDELRKSIASLSVAEGKLENESSSAANKRVASTLRIAKAEATLHKIKTQSLLLEEKLISAQLSNAAKRQAMVDATTKKEISSIDQIKKEKTRAYDKRVKEIQAQMAAVTKAQNLQKQQAKNAKLSGVASAGNSQLAGIVSKNQQAMLKYSGAANSAERAQSKLVRSGQKLNKDLMAGKISVANYNRSLATTISRYNSVTSAGKKLNKGVIETNRSMNAFKGLAAKIAAGATLITGVKLADEFNELQNKLRLTVQPGESLVSVQERLIQTSLTTRSSLQENALLYLRLSNAVDRNVVSQEELFSITETVNKAVQLGGSSAQEAAGAVRQFTQIISSGFVSGFSQEINSLSEQTPGLFNLIVDGLRETSEEFRNVEAAGNKGVSGLKRFSEEGIGDLDMLLKAINSQFTVTDENFSKIGITVSKAMGNVRTALTAYIGKVDDATGFTEALALKINDIALNFEDYANTMISVFKKIALAAGVLAGVMGGVFLRGMLAAAGGMIAANAAAGTLAARLLIFAGPIGAAAGFLATLFLMSSKGKETTKVIEDLNDEIGLLPSAIKLMTDSRLSLEMQKNIEKTKELKAQLKSLNEQNTEGQQTLPSGKRDVPVDLPANSNAISSRDPITNAMVSLYGYDSTAMDQANSMVTTQKEAAQAELKSSIAETTRLIRAAEGERVALIAQSSSNASVASRDAANKMFEAEASRLFKAETLEKEYNKKIVELTIARNDLVTVKEKEKADKVIAEVTRVYNESAEKDKEAAAERLAAFITSFDNEKQIIERNASDRLALAREIVNDKSLLAKLEIQIEAEKIAAIAALKGTEDTSERDAIAARLAAIISSTKSEQYLIEERYAAERKFIDDNMTNRIEAEAIKSALRKKETDEINALTDAELEGIQKYKAGINAVGDAATAFTGLFSGLSDARVSKLNKELSETEDMSDEERRTKEANAKGSFETSKKLTLAGIAMQTGLAVMNALSDTTVLNPYVRAANAAGALAMGASQYASANSQKYSAPTGPSGSVGSPSSSSGASNVSNNTSSTTININAGNSSPAAIAEALQSYINDNDGIIINPDSSQGRLLNA